MLGETTPAERRNNLYIDWKCICRNLWIDNPNWTDEDRVIHLFKFVSWFCIRERLDAESLFKESLEYAREEYSFYFVDLDIGGFI